MNKKKSAPVKKRKANPAKLRTEFRNKLTFHIKKIYCSKSKTINFKSSDRAFLLVALKRALSYDWQKEDIRKFKKREHNALKAFYDEKNYNKALRGAAKEMGWVKESTKDKQNTKQRTYLSPEEEWNLICRFNSLQIFGGLTKKKAVEELLKEFNWHNYDSFYKYISRKSKKYKENHENLVPDEDWQLEDIFMQISELEKQLDI